MKLNLITAAIQRKIGANNKIIVTNGQPDKVVISGQPQSYHALQLALEVVKKNCPGVSIELKPALEYLRNRDLIKSDFVQGTDQFLDKCSEAWI